MSSILLSRFNNARAAADVCVCESAATCVDNAAETYGPDSFMTYLRSIASIFVSGWRSPANGLVSIRI
ncbi:MAG: hypothetical protein J5J06_15540 [Phycisphaerae bacterium]|nr:hypothetical protein [Phycisphaerae bacterium]